MLCVENLLKKGLCKVMQIYSKLFKVMQSYAQLCKVMQNNTQVISEYEWWVPQTFEGSGVATGGGGSGPPTSVLTPTEISANPLKSLYIYIYIYILYIYRGYPMHVVY